MGAGVNGVLRLRRGGPRMGRMEAINFIGWLHFGQHGAEEEGCEGIVEPNCTAIPL